MSEPTRPPLAELLADRTAIAAAIQSAIQQAIIAHAKAGNPVATWEDGKVVWLQPEEILSRSENADTK
jgi:hypothetical protein